MKKYRFLFEKYVGMESLHTCPNCGKRKVFVRYIDTYTDELLPEEYGKCNRAIKCGYWLNPYSDGYTKTVWEAEKQQGINRVTVIETIEKPIEPSFIPYDIYLKSLTEYECNNLVIYLKIRLGNVITAKLIKDYYIGTHNYWHGATVFWQVDIEGRIRTGKIMLYNEHSGKRERYPYNFINWVHKTVKSDNFNLQQCLFGEHLLAKNSIMPVAIVESEKTAIIASAYLPEFIWLACGSLNNLTSTRCQVLKDRKVVLYPDLLAYEAWSKKARALADIAHFAISDLLENNATDEEKKKGLDLADYLLRFDYRQFTQ